MTKSKKRTSRFYTEQDGLYETSDLSPTLSKKTHQKKQSKATAAEKASRHKIVATNTAVQDLVTEEEQTHVPDDLWSSWIQSKA